MKHRINITLGTTQLAELQALSELNGMDKSALITSLINEATDKAVLFEKITVKSINEKVAKLYADTIEKK